MSSFQREAPYPSRQRSPSPGRNDRRGGPVRRYGGGSQKPRSSPASSSSAPEIIDRTRVAPLFIRVYVFEPGTHPSDPNTFEDHKTQASEIHLHTWLDSSLSELRDLLKKVWSQLKDDTPFSIYRKFVTSDGKPTVRLLGSLPVATSATYNQAQTLEQTSFSKGDSLYITMAETKSQ